MDLIVSNLMGMNAIVSSMLIPILIIIMQLVKNVDKLDIAVAFILINI